MISRYKDASWWEKTERRVQEEIENVANNYGKLGDFFNSLTDKNDQELMKIKSLTELQTVVVVNLVYRSMNTNQLTNKEMVVSKNQKETSGRCLVSVEGKNKWIVMWENGSILTFFPDYSKDNLCQFPQKLVKNFDLWLGKGNWTVKKIIDLGGVTPYEDISPDKIPIFWIEIASTKEIKTEKTPELDIFDYEALSTLASKTNDAVALSILTRKYKLDQDERRN